MRRARDHPALGTCPPGAVTAAVQMRLGGAVIDQRQTMLDTMWPSTDVTPADLAALPVNTAAVATDGSPAAVERARTVMERLIPATFAPETIAEQRSRNADDVARLQRLADVVLLASLPIACRSPAAASPASPRHSRSSRRRCLCSPARPDRSPPARAEALPREPTLTCSPRVGQPQRRTG